MLRKVAIAALGAASLVGLFAGPAQADAEVDSWFSAEAPVEESSGCVEGEVHKETDHGESEFVDCYSHPRDYPSSLSAKYDVH
ncbi:hypothetical protein OHS33_10775 [Streptomyces sp. NBC_00536]|uniref:hypothetical protein n=1 Tax=Streptomyces sp. NBC_00536 TaxID=2975769 RepID=UPI002E82067B|nr:hypothetical protein [Streptomyces sp. NBC_00536]WUC78780.1 hypothetical protein OHS33_10775 [Streptomyces sp. NBC_00536]